MPERRRRMPVPGFILPVRDRAHQAAHLQPGPTRPLPDLPDRSQELKEARTEEYILRSIRART